MIWTFWQCQRCFSVFPFFPVCLQFWDGDEKFPPALQILLDGMHWPFSSMRAFGT